MTPTAEQSTILSAAVDTKSNLMINAFAGTGKSTTLRMIERAIPTKPCLYLAFNKRVVDEIAYKSGPDARRMQSTTTVKTLNGIGHGIWGRYRNKPLTLNANKSADILRALINESPRRAQGPLWDSFAAVTSGVAMAKALGHIPEGKFEDVPRLTSPATLYVTLEEEPDDLVCELIDIVLTRSILAAYEGAIDFNDQVYMPALFGGIYPKFPIVMVDEYQDLNPVNHAMIAKLAKTSRLIGVGDRFQNIYGFRGAKTKGMDDAIAEHSMVDLELSVSFRCPSAIVANSLWHVPNFKYSTDGGEVKELGTCVAADVPEGAVFLCRNNAPLFKTAMRFLAAGRSVQVAGTDIGKRLLGTMKKLGEPTYNQSQSLDAVDYWLEERTAKGNKSAADLAECMRVFIRHAPSLSGAIAYAEHLLAAKGTLSFSTGHKAKGLEWDTVYHLDPHLIRTADEQDRNLKYVIETRAKQNLYLVPSEAIDFNVQHQ